MYKCFCFALMCFIMIGAQGKNSDLELEKLLLRYFLEKSADKVETRVDKSEAYVLDKAFKEAVLNEHNKYRSRHGVGPLKYSETMAENAKKVAEHNAELGSLQHSDRKTRMDNGENLFMWFTGDKAFNPETAASDAVNAWYGESKMYDFNHSGFQSGTGHFTQLVWKATTELGCGYMEKETHGMYGIFVVCHYSPAGNMMGEYPENVLRPQKI